MGDLHTVEQLTSCEGEAFREFYQIYAASIAARERKPESWICAMVSKPDYRLLLVKAGGHVIGFSILFLPPGEPFALLEYMAIAAEQRNRGLGGELFNQSVERAVTPQGGKLPVVLEVDSDREASSDRQVRTRRQQFYRRLGCLSISGLHYILPLPGSGPPPEMDLMVRFREPTQQLPKAALARWLRTIYQAVYHCPADDPRITRMLSEVSDPVRLS